MKPIAGPYPLILIPLFPVAAIASWWLIGDQTNAAARELAAQGVKLDYAMQPITLGEAGDRILGIAAGATFLALVALLLAGTVTGRMRSHWWGVAFSVALLGMFAGMVERTYTAGGIGANIGAGLILILGLPCAAMFLVPGVVSAVRLTHERRRASAERRPVVTE